MPLLERGSVRRSRRAQRYALHLEVLYRRLGDSAWQRGVSENLSDTGAVIRGATVFDPDTIVEVVLSLPSSDTHAGGCLTGRAHVVRTLPPSAPTHTPAFVIAFDETRLGRCEKIFDLV